MATTATNNKVRDIGAPKKLSYPVDSAGTDKFNGGDMVCYHVASGHLVAATDANAAEFAGVAEDSSQMSPYGTAVIQAQASVQVNGIFVMGTTAAETYAHGDALYIGADAQTVTKVNPGSGKVIGYAWMRAGVTSVAGGAGVSLDVLIVPQYPAGAIA